MLTSPGMPRTPENDPPVDALVLLILLGILLFASPVILWWTDPESPWYLPYLLWLTLIALGGLLFGRYNHSRTDPGDDP